MPISQLSPAKQPFKCLFSFFWRQLLMIRGLASGAAIIIIISVTVLFPQVHSLFVFAIIAVWTKHISLNININPAVIGKRVFFVLSQFADFLSQTIVFLSQIGCFFVELITLNGCHRGKGRGYSINYYWSIFDNHSIFIG